MLESDEPKIIRADKALRRITIIVVAVALVVGSLTVVYSDAFLRDIRALAERSPREAASKLATVLKVLAMSGAMLFVAAGWYYARSARLVWRTGEFPPPGTRVIRDTAVITGSASRRRALWAMLVAAVLTACGIAIPIFTWIIVESLLRGITLGRGI